jgi:hypothetical protein
LGSTLQEQRKTSSGSKDIRSLRVIALQPVADALNVPEESALSSAFLSSAAGPGIEIVSESGEEALLAVIDAGGGRSGGSVVLLDLTSHAEWQRIAGALPRFDHRHIVWLILLGSCPQLPELAKLAAHLNTMAVRTAEEAAVVGALVRKMPRLGAEDCYRSSAAALASLCQLQLADYRRQGKACARRPDKVSWTES